jgi:hypothetical protein
MTAHDNHPLSEQAKQAIKDGEAAWVRVSSGNWDVSAWWVMGTALTLIRAQVLHETGINQARGSLYNKAFERRLATTKFATMESVTRSNLLYLMEPEIRVVLDRLLASWKPDIRARRTHPTTLAQYVRRELKPPKPVAPTAPAAPQPKVEPDAARSALQSELSKVRLENSWLREQLAEKAKLEARIRELEDKPRGQRPVARSDAKGDTMACKCIRMLAAENDHQALQAARALVSELNRIGADVGDLSDAWKPVEQKLTAPRPRPIDFAKVEEVVKRYAQGKTGVGIIPVIDRVEAAVPGTNWRAQNNNREIMNAVHNAIERCLYQLGFKQSARNRDRWTKQ